VQNLNDAKTKPAGKRAPDIFCAAVFILLTASCSAGISGVFNTEGGVSLKVSGEFKPKISVLIKKLASNNTDVLINAKRINDSLNSVPEVKNADFRNAGAGGIRGSFEIGKTEQFLKSNAPSGRQFITTTRNGGVTHISIYLDRKSASVLVGTLLPELQAYLSAIAAPVATGEELGKAEYLDTVKSIYGAPLAEEIGASQITLALSFPGRIKSASGKNITVSGSTAVIQIPLPDLLVMDSDLIYEIDIQSD